MSRQRIAAESELGEGQCLKFEYSREGVPREGFVARHRGRLVAYENACRHIPLPLDYGDNRFFTRDGEHFICQSHGALYDPQSGACLRGPCAGASLKRLDIEIADGSVWLLL